MYQYTLETYDKKGRLLSAKTAEFEKRFDCLYSLEGEKTTPECGASYIFDNSRKRARDGRLPLRKCRTRLTPANCLIDAEKQVKMYAAWAIERGLQTIHLFPAGRQGHSANTHYELRNIQALHLQRGVVFIEVNPSDWKLKP